MGTQEKVCRLCLKICDNYIAIEGDIENTLYKVLPSIDLSIIEKPVSCALCHESLDNCSRFVTDCLMVENKIKEYYETLDLNKSGRIELSSLLQFTRNMTSDVDNLVNRIKEEKQICYEDENIEKNVDYRSKSFMDVDDDKFDNEEQYPSKHMLICREDNDKSDVIKMEETCGKHLSEANSVGLKDQKSLVQEEIEIKTDNQDFSRFDDGVVLPQPGGTTRVCKIQRCLMPKLKGNLSCNKHSETNKNATKVTMYQCASCSFHTKHKHHFRDHLLKHKDPSEVTVYKCNSCSYQTVIVYEFKRHILIHKSPLEVTMHKCDSCSFVTKHKNGLKRHSLQHKDPSEVTMYKCDSCSYQTKDKHYLKSHLVKHKNSSEEKMYKCASCSYQAVRKMHLKSHLLVHKDPSEVTMYKCDFCSLQTKRKGQLKMHLLLHQDPSEATTYKCDFCSYQTIVKSGFRKHLAVHKSPSEVRMYNCDSCSYQTKRKDTLKTHSLVHKDPSDVTIYNCDSCSYKTKYIGNLKNHFLQHKDPSEVITYKCDSCSFRTKRKYSLKNHLLKCKDFQKHNDPSERTTLTFIHLGQVINFS